MKKIGLLLLILSQSAFASVTVSLDAKHKQMIVRTSTSSSKVPLNLPKGMDLEGAPKYFGDDDFGVIIFEVADEAAATVLVYAVDGKGKKLWSMDLEAFNASTPLIEKDFVYLAGIGKVFKVEKKSGKVVWTHTGLFENKKYTFNGAENILRKDKQIIFSEKLHVDDQTGKVFEVNL